MSNTSDIELFAISFANFYNEFLLLNSTTNSIEVFVTFCSKINYKVEVKDIDMLISSLSYELKKLDIAFPIDLLLNLNSKRAEHTDRANIFYYLFTSEAFVNMLHNTSDTYLERFVNEVIVAYVCNVTDLFGRIPFMTALPLYVSKYHDSILMNDIMKKMAKESILHHTDIFGKDSIDHYFELCKNLKKVPILFKIE